MIWAARRFRLAGDRAFALYVALYSAGMFATQSVRIDYSHHIAGLRVNQWVAVLAFAVAAGYLYRTRRARTPASAGQPLAHPAPAAPNAGADPGRRQPRRGHPLATSGYGSAVQAHVTTVTLLCYPWPRSSRVLVLG